MDENRVVQVHFSDRSASGYLITDRLVLTTAHLNHDEPDETGAAVKISPHLGGGGYDAIVVWRGTPHGHDDVAVAEIRDTAWDRRPDRPVSRQPRLGRLVTGDTPAEAIGYPIWTARPNPASWNFTGRLSRINNANHGEYAFTTDQPPPQHRGPGDSPWGGMSGAAVFARGSDLLVGVVKADIGGGNHANLSVVPLYAILGALSELGVSSATYPVELDRLADSRTPFDQPHQLADLRNSEKMMAKLADWCEGAGFAAWLLSSRRPEHGTQLARTLSARLDEKWTTLWLADSAATATIQILEGVSRPLLIIVRSAETRTAQLKELLQAVDRNRHGTPIRLLLLSATTGGWLKNLKSGDPDIEKLLDNIRARELESWNKRITIKRRVTVVALVAVVSLGGAGVAKVVWPQKPDNQTHGSINVTPTPGPFSSPTLPSAPSVPSSSGPAPEGPENVPIVVPSSGPPSTTPTPTPGPASAPPSSRTMTVTNSGDHWYLGFDVDTEKFGTGPPSSWQEYRVRFDRIYPEQPDSGHMGTLQAASLEDCSNLSGFKALGDYNTGSPLAEGPYCAWSNGKTAKKSSATKLACLIIISDLKWHQNTITATPGQAATSQKEYTSFVISKQCEAR